MDEAHLSESDVRPASLIDFILQHTSIRWRTRSLPAQPEWGPNLTMILEDLPDDAPDWWSPRRAKRLLNQMDPLSRELAQRMIASSECTYGIVFRSMRSHKPLSELQTNGATGWSVNLHSVGGQHILFKAGRGRYFIRLFTSREITRLMGADDYAISVPLNEVLSSFGEGPCVPVIEWIAQYYLNPLVNELIHGRPLVLTFSGDPLTS